MQYIGLGLLLLLGGEVLSILLVAKLVGGLAAFGLMVLSFVFGLWLLRGTAGLSKVLVAGGLLRGNGQMSFYQMLWPIRIPFAGLLLMSPGFLSSLLALLLLIPFGGKPSDTAAFASAVFTQAADARKADRNGARADDVIEGEFVVRENGSGAPSEHTAIEHKKF